MKQKQQQKERLSEAHLLRKGFKPLVILYTPTGGKEGRVDKVYR